MKLLKFTMLISSFILVACENSQPVDPSNQIGQQDGHAIFQVTLHTNKFRPSYSENIEQKSVIVRYCPNGGDIISKSALIGTGGYGIYQNFGIPMRTEILKYDLTFVCK